MHICFVSYDTPGRLGGPLVNVRRLLPRLADRGHDVAVLVLHSGGESALAAEFRDAGIECRCLPFPRYTTDGVRWILKQVRDLQPDVFVANSLVAGFFASRWIRAAGIPTVAALRADDRFHGALVEEFVAGEPEWAVSGLVAVSDELARGVAARSPRHTKVAVIPSGVPIPETGCDPGGNVRMAYVGLLDQRRKRVLETARAMARVLAAYPDATASFYGDGFDRQELEDYVGRQSFGDRMTVEGLVPCERIQDRLKAHNVIVLLSDAEGTPGALMDGMACGLVPVCLGISGGLRELVRHEQTGLIVHDRNGSFFSAIERLRADETMRASLGGAAREHVARHYALDSCVEKWESFAGKLLEGKGTEETHRVAIPRFCRLPPPRPGLDREDVRRDLSWKRIKEELRLVPWTVKEWVKQTSGLSQRPG